MCVSFANRFANSVGLAKVCLVCLANWEAVLIINIIALGGIIVLYRTTLLAVSISI